MVLGRGKGMKLFLGLYAVQSNNSKACKNPNTKNKRPSFLPTLTEGEA